MGARGGYCAITPGQTRRLLAAYETSKDPDEFVLEVMDALQEEVPERWRLFLDSAWDDIHRTLTLDNTPDNKIDIDAGEFPLNLAFFGGQSLYEGGDFHIYLIRPDEVAGLAAALQEVDEPWLRKRFFTIDPATTVGGVDEQTFAYLRNYFRGLPRFFARAAAQGRAVVFEACL
jgi:hypothetical protein